MVKNPPANAGDTSGLNFKEEVEVGEAMLKVNITVTEKENSLITGTTGKTRYHSIRNGLPRWH